MLFILSDSLPDFKAGFNAESETKKARGFLPVPLHFLAGF